MTKIILRSIWGTFCYYHYAGMWDHKLVLWASTSGYNWEKVFLSTHGSALCVESFWAFRVCHLSPVVSWGPSKKHCAPVDQGNLAPSQPVAALDHVKRQHK